LKSVLKRAEKASKELSQLNVKSLKLARIKITKDNPDTGHFRLKALLTEKEFIEIFEFYFSGNLLKYSYTYIKDDNSILRYDNAPHLKKLKSFPHHKHIKDKIKELEKPQLEEFLRDLMKMR